MMYPLIAARIFATTGLLISFRCECLILDVRSKRLLLACVLFGFFINELTRVVPIPRSLMLIVINPLVTLVAPIVLTRGPLFSRMARVALVNLATFLSEVLCMVCYLILEHQPNYTTVDARNFPHVVITYMTGFIVQVFVTELIIYRLQDRKAEGSPQFSAPILAFVMGTYLFLLLCVNRYTLLGARGMLIPLMLLTVAVLSILLSFVLNHIAHEEMRPSREATERVAMLRQARHIRRQIENSASRVVNMRRLRHDLANQMGVVVELARTGRADEADRYLSELLEKARDFLEDPRG